MQPDLTSQCPALRGYLGMVRVPERWADVIHGESPHCCDMAAPGQQPPENAAGSLVVFSRHDSQLVKLMTSQDSSVSPRHCRENLEQL